MKIFLGADHGGFSLKEKIKDFLQDISDLEIEDSGIYEEKSVDYPDIAKALCQKLQKDKDAKGILFCGTGIGMSIVANKMKGIRAALCTDTYMAKMSREHNDANILILGGRVVGEGLAKDIVLSFLNTDFSGGRHLRRLEKIMHLED